MAALARMAEAAGAPPTRLMADIAALSIGPGRIAFSDYERLRLYDADFWAPADRRQVVGARRARELALRANFRHDWFGFAANRVALAAYLAVHGLPGLRLEAVYAPGLATPGAQVLRGRDELRDFLEARAGRPLVARAAEGEAMRVMSACDGAEAAAQIDRLVDELDDNAGLGWFFHEPHRAHPALARKTAGRLPTLRLLTLTSAGEPMVIRAVFGVPGPERIVGRMDLKTGRTVALMRADAPEHVTSPKALAAPDWAAIKALAVEGARLLSPFGLLGWDIAPTAEGPVILGVTPTPDVALHQLVDRRGLLDALFLAFLDERRRLAADHAERLRLETASA